MRGSKKPYDWEKHYLHDKAVRDAMCLQHGIHPPDDPKYGTLNTKIPTIAKTKVIGKRFYEELNKLGHDNAAFEICSCKDKK